MFSPIFYHILLQCLLLMQYRHTYPQVQYIHLLIVSRHFFHIYLQNLWYEGGKRCGCQIRLFLAFECDFFNCCRRVPFGRKTLYPVGFNHLSNKCIWVDFPEPSIPSTTIRLPKSFLSLILYLLEKCNKKYLYIHSMCYV